jgi:GntR family transcriptional repressor for pyruvate dehydrogenase complex
MQDNVTTVKEYQKADMDFHMAIAEASHNNLFVFILRAIRPLMEDMILKTIKEERPEHSLGLHEKISKAISTGDTEEALSAMKKHLEAGKYMSNH